MATMQNLYRICSKLLTYSASNKFLLFFLFSASPIVEYIDSQFDKYLQQELKIRRTLNSYNDTRVHVCLYFVSPTGHS